MDVMILRLVLDASFFMAVFNPLISGDNQVIRWGLTIVLAVWMGWIVTNWKKKDLEGRVQDIALTIPGDFADLYAFCWKSILHYRWLTNNSFCAIIS